MPYSDKTFHSKFTSQQLEEAIEKILLIKRNSGEINYFFDYIESEIYQKELLKTKNISAISEQKTETEISNKTIYYDVSDEKIVNTEYIIEKFKKEIIEYNNINLEINLSWIKNYYIILFILDCESDSITILVDNKESDFDIVKTNKGILAISKNKVQFKNINIEVRINE